MASFFTSLERKESNFVGIVYDSNTLQVVYTSQPHQLQENALNEVNHFIQTFKSTNVSSNQNTDSNVEPTQISSETTPTPQRRPCGCGR